MNTIPLKRTWPKVSRRHHCEHNIYRQWPKIPIEYLWLIRNKLETSWACETERRKNEWMLFSLFGRSPRICNCNENITAATLFQYYYFYRMFISFFGKWWTLLLLLHGLSILICLRWIYSSRGGGFFLLEYENGKVNNLCLR